MLRYLVLILLIVNIAFWGWAHGWFGNQLGMNGREPERMTNQIRPEALRALPPGTVPAEPAATAPTDPATLLVCLETGPLDSAQAHQIQQLIAPVLPQNIWEMHVQSEPKSWLIYMGKFDSEDQALNKKNELIRLGIPTTDIDIIRNRPALQPGLSLGHFKEKSNITRMMETLASKGITNAQIIEWELTPIGQRLRVSQATPAQHEQLAALGAQIGIPPFTECASQD